MNQVMILQSEKVDFEEKKMVPHDAFFAFKWLYDQYQSILPSAKGFLSPCHNHFTCFMMQID
jgi:hypothetical protein